MVFYLVMVYLPGWLSRYVGIGEGLALEINSLLTFIVIPLMVLFAWIGDQWIRRTRLIAIALFILGITVWPLTSLMQSGSILAIVGGQFVMFALTAVPLGSAPAVFLELFPSSDRLTGYSVSFNLGVGILGGATPALATWLIGLTGVSVTPAIMTLLACFFAASALMWMTDRSREPLR